MDTCIKDFLCFCLHEDAQPKESFSSIDWQKLLEFGKKQSIVGVLFHGITRLKKEDAAMPHNVFKQWVGNFLTIKMSNQQVYKDANFLTKAFHKETGKNCVVLKGQANALMYPDPYMRNPGDIDLWTDMDNVPLILWVRRHDPKGEIGYHHIQMSALSTPVEVHFVPSFMGNLFYEWRLRKYFKENKQAQFNNTAILPDKLGEINVLRHDFDCIFQLSHIMHHFFFEGIGFRQLIDFYYLLTTAKFSDKEKEEIMAKLRWLNMAKFTTAVMYIMKDVFNMDASLLLGESNEHLGKVLLSEILKSGNFGFYDDRYSFANTSVYKQYFIEIFRNLHFALDYPSETIYGRPVSRWWHMFYKAWLRREVKKASEKQRLQAQ